MSPEVKLTVSSGLICCTGTGYVTGPSVGTKVLSEKETRTHDIIQGHNAAVLWRVLKTAWQCRPDSGVGYRYRKHHSTPLQTTRSAEGALQRTWGSYFPSAPVGAKNTLPQDLSTRNTSTDLNFFMCKHCLLIK